MARLFIGGAVLALCASASLLSAADDPLLDQKERQKQIQADTDQVVRRLGTMLRVLEYYQVNKQVEKKLLEEVAVTLAGLSRDQMNQVISRLDAAVRAENAAKSEENLAEAYARHREILDSFKTILAKYDAVKSLEQVAERLDKAARIQLELHLVTGQLIDNVVERQRPALSPLQRQALFRQFPNMLVEKKRQGDAQGDLRKDVETVLKQAAELRAKLPAEQQERLRAMEELAAKQRLMDKFYRVVVKLGVPFNQFDSWKAGNGVQWEIAGQLRDLARALRKPSEDLVALREIRGRLEQTIRHQEGLRDQAKEQSAKKESLLEMMSRGRLPPPLPSPGTKPLPGRNQQLQPQLRFQEELAAAAEAMQKNAELSTQQARLQFETQETHNLAKPLDEAIGDKVQTAEKAMNDARAALEKKAADKALAPQEKAVEALRQAKKGIERRIAAAEKERNDPMAALQKAADAIDHLLQEQTAAREQTRDAAKDDHDLKLPPLADKQAALTNQAENLKDSRLPKNEKAQAGLEKAAEQMKKAAENLADRKAKAAVPHQEKALEALENAKTEIGRQMAEISKRREEIATLEQAADKLAELTKHENMVARELAQEPAAPLIKALGQVQEELTPQAKKMQKQLEQAVPPAAERVAESAKHMEATQQKIAKRELSPAAREADQAARKLADATEAVAKALQKLKAKELADQAAMMPNKFDPAAAAQQVAKALEQTRQAAREAKHAEALAKLDQPGPKQDLGKLQKQIAKRAAQMDLPEASQSAQKAAEAIERSDLLKALPEQETTLTKLQHAAAKKPATDVAAQPTKSAESKAGAPPAVQAKSTTAEPFGLQTAEAKNAPVEPAQAKAGNATPGQSAAEAKTNPADPADAKPFSAPAERNSFRSKSADQAQSTPLNTAQSKPGDTRPGQKAAQSKDSQSTTTKAERAKIAKPDLEYETSEAKTSRTNAGESKSGEPENGRSKPALSKNEAGDLRPETKEHVIAQAKKGTEPSQKPQEQSSAKAGKDEDDQGSGKANGNGQMQPADAKTPDQLAEAQKDLLDATKALTKSYEATDAALTALGQAQAQAPEGVQPQLEEAAKKLAQAGKALEDGTPGKAGEDQGHAAAKLESALKTLKEALDSMTPDSGSGSRSDVLARTKPKEDKDGPGGQDKGDGQQKLAQNQGKGLKKGLGYEKNTGKGMGQREAGGKLESAKSRLKDVQGDGSFLYLPPRQREMVRQALAGQLPPEYAALIQQYYVNIARGRPATTPVPLAPPPKE